MLRDDILHKLRSDKETLNAFGVKSIGVFGSVARGEAAADSDVDIVVDFVDESIPGLFGFVRLKRHLEELLGRSVDLVTPASPNRRVNEVIENEAVYA
jgi:predicted nucleotidyltransferase